MFFDALNPKMAFIFPQQVRFYHKTGLNNWKNCLKQEFFLINFYLKMYNTAFYLSMKS